MKIANLILSFTISLPTMAGGYLKLGKEYVDKEVHEIKNFPTIRTQDGVGICYSASATQLLNYEYCKQNNLDCSLPENQLSLLDVTARYEYMTKSISIGGSPFTLLRNLKDHTRTLYKEQCLPFELLAHKDAERHENAQGDAYEVLEQIFNLNPRYLSEEQKTCHAKTLKAILPIEKDLAAIMDAFHSNTIAQFVYEVAVRDECSDTQQKVKVPAYNTGIYPSHSNREEIDATNLLSKLEKLVLNDIPVSLSFCSATYYQKDRPETCGAHAATIVGIKESCKNYECRTLVKVHNSYGQSWQDRHNDGWVDAMSLMQRSLDFGDTELLTWISSYKRESEIPEKSLKRTHKTQTIKKTSYGASSQNKWGGPTKKEVATDSYPESINPQKAPVFTCDNSYFGEWKPNSNCRFMMYRQ